jgi:DNA (cytosine-5)-methyltransferase 1
MNYYNEHDPKAAAWLRELINAGLIPTGDVDERSIVDLQPDELRGYTQCHFFAGIGGWSLALQLAGWPADKPVWTGSCPCQPFSAAGKGLGDKDERHLWPVFFNLIKECKPNAVFGEQVASAIGKGWLDGVSADLESEDYACGATVLGAHSVGAPHIRQRLYWVADSELCRRERIKVEQCTGILKTMDGKEESQFAISPHSASFRRLADSESIRQQGQGIVGESGNSKENQNREVDRAFDAGWSDFTTVHCRDGKTRRIPTEPAFFPLAHGIPARVVRLRGYGNAIVPQVASEFIKAFIDSQTTCLAVSAK